MQSLKTLIKLGGNVMVTDKNERTALHWAAEENQTEIMKVLLMHFVCDFTEVKLIT